MALRSLLGAIFLLPGVALAGCTATTASSCTGKCLWNFVASCCYEKGEANCANSVAFIATKPQIDSTNKIGIAMPGSEATATLKEVPLEAADAPAFGPTSMGGQSHMLMSGVGITDGTIGGALPSALRMRRRR